MGIDFSHCDARWSYSGFNRFRIRLAKEIGIDLDKMEGFCRHERGLSWGKIVDPIAPLLNHSDCDGVLSVKDCKAVAPRLRELVSDWGEADFDKGEAIRLAEGMERAIERGEELEFR